MHRKITVGIAKQQPWLTIRGCSDRNEKIIICIWRVRLQLNHQMYYVLLLLPCGKKASRGTLKFIRYVLFVCLLLRKGRMFDKSVDSLSGTVRLPQKVTRQTRVVKSSSIVKCTRPRFLNPKLKHHHFC